jgi:hypothetical protein
MAWRPGTSVRQSARSAKALDGAPTRADKLLRTLSSSLGSSTTPSEVLLSGCGSNGIVSEKVTSGFSSRKTRRVGFGNAVSFWPCFLFLAEAGFCDGVLFCPSSFFAGDDAAFRERLANGRRGDSRVDMSIKRLGAQVNLIMHKRKEDGTKKCHATNELSSVV